MEEEKVEEEAEEEEIGPMMGPLIEKLMGDLEEDLFEEMEEGEDSIPKLLQREIKERDRKKNGLFLQVMGEEKEV